MIVFPELCQANASYLPIADNSVDCVVTSPPYWGLRDYGLDEQGIGLEPTLEEFCTNTVAVFREVWRVLKPTGTVWMNLGDSYRDKQLVGISWSVAFALQADGWYLRSDIIWSKPNPMPESVQDRPTKAHEYIFLLTKKSKYYYDADAIREPHTSDKVHSTFRSSPRYLNNNSFNNSHEPSDITDGPEEHEGKYKDTDYGGSGSGFNGHIGSYKAEGQPLNHPLGKNKRSVWEIPTHPYPEAHFATFPEKLAELCILAGSPEGGIVLDPFVGSGTTMVVAQKHRRKGIGIDLNKEYLDLAVKRIKNSKYNNQFVLF